MGTMALRRVDPGDIKVFFAEQLDPEAIRMAAFTVADPTDRTAFDARWRTHLGDPEIIARTITIDDEVVGSISAYPSDDGPEVTFWIDRARWGKGIASRALAAFLDEVTERPLYARVATDNIGSLTVLERCGFSVTGRSSAYANGRRAETEEFSLVLKD